MKLIIPGLSYIYKDIGQRVPGYTQIMQAVDENIVYSLKTDGKSFLLKKILIQLIQH